MKTFQQFITEVYDKDLEGQATRKPGEGGRIRAARKKGEGYLAKQQQGQKPRIKAIGGGKTAPATDYKPRKDIGANKPRSQREQQPTQTRGSAALSPREAQRKAAIERRAAKSGVKTKTAAELLAKKAKKTVDPKYKPQKASGMTQSEREALTKRGEKKLRDLRLQSTGKTKESELKYPITKKEIARRKKASK
jgi:hypothetical protein